MDESVQALMQRYIPLSDAQRERIGQFCACVLLAGSSQVSQLARWLGREAKLDYREQWLRRLLNASYVSQELVYEAWFKQAVKGYQSKEWHLVMDRTNLVDKEVDLVTLALAYRHRAIPIKWEQIQYGGASTAQYIKLIQRASSLIPESVRVTFHGDAEFGAMPMINYLRQQNWDYILGQRRHYTYQDDDGQWYPLESLAMTKRKGIYLNNITLTRTHEVSDVNLFGFMHYGKNGQNEQRFFATSLPIAHTLRQLGRRRWGIECCFQDFKSSGWNLEACQIPDADARERLLVFLSMCYLWATCMGRWLCKTGQRSLVDKSARRQASLFRIGWDWIVHQFRQQQPIPHLLTLYS